MSRSGDLTRYLENLQEEIDAAALYDAMASAEKDRRLADIYRRLAETERKHAEFWSAQVANLGVEVPEVAPSLRARILCWLARRFGPRTVLPTMARQEVLGKTRYDDQPEAKGTSLPLDERSHAVLLASLQAGAIPQVEPDESLATEAPGQPISVPVSAPAGSVIARLEGRHRSVQGNTLRAAVLGANDGLVSNLALVMGVSGADLSRHQVLIAGIAGLLAGSISMALGEWLSVRSSRELYEHEMEVEAEELEAHPESEAEELKLIFEARGLDSDQAEKLAQEMVKDKVGALDIMAREELGIDPEELGGSPMAAAGASFLLFALGAIIPVFPFIFAGGLVGVAASLAASGIGLFLLGAATTLLTGRSALFAGTRSLAIGLAAAAVTFGVGKLLGISLSG